MSEKQYTVAELVEKLKTYPADLPVLVTGYEGGYEHISSVEQMQLEQKADSPYWDGEFQEVNNEKLKTVRAVVLHRMVRDV